MALFRVTYNVREGKDLMVKRQFIVQCSSRKSLEKIIPNHKEYDPTLNVFWEIEKFIPMDLKEFKEAYLSGDEGL